MTADELSNAISETNEKVEESEAKKEVDVVFDIEIRVKKPRYARCRFIFLLFCFY